MLVLSRKKNECIILGDGPDAIKIYVVDIGPGKVRIGVEASKEVPVHRLEIYEAIQREGRRIK
jgi:carbon storage regulator